jgi:hypothetical protein
VEVFELPLPIAFYRSRPALQILAKPFHSIDLLPQMVVFREDLVMDVSEFIVMESQLSQLSIEIVPFFVPLISTLGNLALLFLQILQRISQFLIVFSASFGCQLFVQVRDVDYQRQLLSRYVLHLFSQSLNYRTLL